jgi:hypothetical protein
VLNKKHARKSFVEATCIECGTIEEGPDFVVAKDRQYQKIVLGNLQIDIT